MAEVGAATAASSAGSIARSKKGKRVICISSDDGDEDDEFEEEEEEASGSEFEIEEEEEAESEEESDEEDSLSSEDGSGSSSDDRDDDDYVHDDDDDDDDDVDNDDVVCDDPDSKRKGSDEEHCNKIIGLLRGRNNLNRLKLEECKAYLRKHELRISGTRETCIKRILEHWRIKDGNGEKLYPQSSFVINCTGDVCKGDVVLFKQRVYDKFDIVRRGGGGRIIGKRVIAGRVVKESYGSAKQQHTFSIDVLWSKGVKPLPPLFPLLVKGRNLYRLKTFRQPWPNEAERSRVLAEKHTRGAAARHVRAVAKDSKRKRKSSGTKPRPNKKRKHDHELASRKKKENITKKSSNALAKTRKVQSTHGHVQARKVAKERNRRPSAAQDHANTSELAKTRTSKSSARPMEQPRHYPTGIFREHLYPQRYTCYDYSRLPAEVHTNNVGIPQADRGMHHLPSYNAGCVSAVRVPHGHMQHDHNVGYPTSAHSQGSNRAGYHANLYGNPSFERDPRRQVVSDDLFLGGQCHGWRRPNFSYL